MADTPIIFANKKHENFYYSLNNGQVDCYYRSLIYLLGISQDTRNHFDQIFDIKTGCIKTECLHEGWQTSGSIRIVRLAFNLYTNGMPMVDDMKQDARVAECREYSVSNIFCCGYAPYFWEAIRLRYPEYC